MTRIAILTAEFTPSRGGIATYTRCLAAALALWALHFLFTVPKNTHIRM